MLLCTSSSCMHAYNLSILSNHWCLQCAWHVKCCVIREPHLQSCFSLWWLLAGLTCTIQAQAGEDHLCAAAEGAILSGKFSTPCKQHSLTICKTNWQCPSSTREKPRTGIPAAMKLSLWCRAGAYFLGFHQGEGLFSDTWALTFLLSAVRNAFLC